MLRLRPYRKSDAQQIVHWIKDERTFFLWSADKLGNYPVTPDALHDFYEKNMECDDFYVMTAFDEEGPVGQLFMRFMDQDKTHLHFGFIVVDDSKRGKGYGREMLQLALKYAFEILKVSRVTLGVFEDNQKAYGCYKKVGFRENVNKKPQIYHLMDEEWNCIELEITEY